MDLAPEPELSCTRENLSRSGGLKFSSCLTSPNNCMCFEVGLGWLWSIQISTSPLPKEYNSQVKRQDLLIVAVLLPPLKYLTWPLARLKHFFCILLIIDCTVETFSGDESSSNTTEKGN